MESSDSIDCGRHRRAAADPAEYGLRNGCRRKLARSTRGRRRGKAPCAAFSDHRYHVVRHPNNRRTRRASRALKRDPHARRNQPRAACSRPAVRNDRHCVAARSRPLCRRAHQPARRPMEQLQRCCHRQPRCMDSRSGRSRHVGQSHYGEPNARMALYKAALLAVERRSGSGSHHLQRVHRRRTRDCPRPLGLRPCGYRIESDGAAHSPVADASISGGSRRRPGRAAALQRGPGRHRAPRYL